MIRIATWNVERPRPSELTRRKRLLEAMQSIDADVWILTETHTSLAPGEDFTAVTTEKPNRIHESGETWVAIWSRFPIEPLARTSDPAHALAARIIPDSTRSIVVYGTVLPWLGSTWQNIPSANGAAFSAALTVQLADWISLQHDNPGCDFVLSGDLNQDLAWSHYYGSRQNRAALKAALIAAELRCLTAADLDPIPRHAPDCASIDHICVSSGLALTGSPVSWPTSERPLKNLSDHFGVSVELANIYEI